MDEHQERVTWPAWLGLLLLAVMGIVGTAVMRLLKDRPPLWVILASSAIVPLLLLIAWKFRHLEVRFSREAIAYGFGRATRFIPRARIRSCTAESYEWARYMGWGWRIGPKPRERAYSILGCRRGVRVLYLDDAGQECSLFLSSRDPEAACRAANR